jgi:hypothetical protein
LKYRIFADVNVSRTSGRQTQARSSHQNATLRTIINKSAGKVNNGLVFAVEMRDFLTWNGRFSHRTALPGLNSVAADEISLTRGTGFPNLRHNRAFFSFGFICYVQRRRSKDEFLADWGRK